MKQTQNKVTNVSWFFYDLKTKMVCLHRRDNETPNSPNCWDCFGGAIDKGETVEEAFRRELQEELGVNLDDVKSQLLTIEGNNEVYYIYFPFIKSGKFSIREGAGLTWLKLNYVIDKLESVNEEARLILIDFKKRILNDPTETGQNRN